MSAPYRDQVAELLALREELETERAARLELAAQVAEDRAAAARQSQMVRRVLKWVLPPLGTIALAGAAAWLATDRAKTAATTEERIRRTTAEADHALLRDVSFGHAVLTGRVDALERTLTLFLGRPRPPRPAVNDERDTP